MCLRVLCWSTLAGLHTVIAADTSFTVDRTPPIAGQVYDGSNLGMDSQFQDRQDSVCVNWVGFSDPHTGIGRVEWTIGKF
jgi:hypothetical protein